MVVAVVDLTEKGCLKVDLTLKCSKCELVTVDPEVITENILSQCVHVSPSTAVDGDTSSGETEEALTKYANDTYLLVPSSNRRRPTVPSELNHISSWAINNNLKLKA